MAERREIAGDLDDLIKALASKAVEANHPTNAMHYASAARQLAEARAWIISPGNAHGSNASDKSA